MRTELMHDHVEQELMQHKLVFIETTDVVETTLALDNFRRACDCGRGAVFFSVARGKVAEVRRTLRAGYAALRLYKVLSSKSMIERHMRAHDSSVSPGLVPH